MLRLWMQVALHQIGATAGQEIYNSRMSVIRNSVERSYKELKKSWSIKDYPRTLRIQQAPILLLHITSVILLKFKMRMYSGGQVQSYFNCPLLPFQRYLHSI